MQGTDKLNTITNIVFVLTDVLETNLLEMQQKYRNKYRKFCIIRLLSSILKNENPLSTYHLLCESLYSSCFQNGDRLFATYHLIYHLSPANLDKIYCKRKQ